MNIYKISKSQLITSWIFGILYALTIAIISDTEYILTATLAILVPYLLFFYTLGWKQVNKDIKNTKKENIIYCNECGQKLLEDAKFCNKCGNTIKK
ncbi:MAG: zinc ribbon domain-containing protein [Patescibacteria group bacterium]|nr:zinc ribbon domain-containing protein [Patescibacteria group bacterium]MDD4304221.1 zinc ribbon domain-containing protein [Patescibacteria group bacterium]MDD4695254.1 zinc ribbon domain-containing protein [Patescibacteria group bacterium]